MVLHDRSHYSSPYSPPKPKVPGTPGGVVVRSSSSLLSLLVVCCFMALYMAFTNIFQSLRLSQCHHHHFDNNNNNNNSRCSMALYNMTSNFLTSRSLRWSKECGQNHYNDKCQDASSSYLGFLPDAMMITRRIPNATKIDTTRRLEFVHIPKTGGTSIENAYAKDGKRWGYYKFYNRRIHAKNRPGGVHFDEPRPVRIPRLQQQQQQQEYAHVLPKYCRLWHLPPWKFDGLPLPYNIYHNANLFAVVRDPYSRIISEYYYNVGRQQEQQQQQQKGSKRLNTKLASATTTTTIQHQRVLRKDNPKQTTPVLYTKDHLNFWLQRLLKKRLPFQDQPNAFFMNGFCDNGGRLIPQYHYVYDAKGQQVIHHVLKFEHLDTEFAALMAQYGLQRLTLPHANKSGGMNATSTTTSLTSQPPPPRFTKDDLTKETLELIETIYHLDFVFFGYPQILNGTSSRMEEKENKDEHKHKTDSEEQKDTVEAT